MRFYSVVIYCLDSLPMRLLSNSWRGSWFHHIQSYMHWDTGQLSAQSCSYRTSRHRSTERYIRVFPSHAFLLNGRAWLVIGHKAGINPEVQSVAIVLLIELQRKQPASSLQLCQSPHSFSACAYDNVDFWKCPEKILFESAVLFLTVEDGVIIHFHQIIGFFCYFCEPPDLPLNPVIWPWVLFV